MNNCANGTSINDLKKQQEIQQKQFEMNQMMKMQELNELQKTQNIFYNANQNKHYEQGHNAAYDTLQNQQDPYYTMQNNYGYMEQNIQPHVLANNLNVELPNIKKEADILTELANEEKEHFDNKKKSKSVIPRMLVSPLIIFILFVILSLPSVRINIGKFIPQIRPNASGNTAMTGVIIYGIILSVLFVIVQKLFYKLKL